MPVEVARKIKALVQAGATVAGPKPQSDPGLRNYPQCDAEVKQLADEVWGACDGKQVQQQSFGQGRVCWGKPLSEIFLADGVLPDFAISSKDAFIDFIHRATPNTDLYFLANRKGGAETTEATFRVSGRQPELWDPVTGKMRDLPQFDSKDGCTTVPLEFDPSGSMFVVFRKATVGTGRRAVRLDRGVGANGPATPSNFPKLSPVQEITGPWTVQFDAQWFYPTAGLDSEPAKGRLVFANLDDWSKRPEPAVKNFSGTAVYRKTFDLADSSKIQNSKFKILLDLGTVKETARVKLNGKDLGVVWCTPWRVEITGAVKTGNNALEIEVVNLWPNRLIGDDALPEADRKTRTNISFDKSQPLLSSGLLGPVRVMAAE